MNRRHKSREQWQAVVHRYEQRSVSAEVFCQREGICQASLYRWRKLLTTGPLRDSQKSDWAALPLTDSADSAAPSEDGFLDLGLVGTSTAPLQLRLDLGGGITLTLRRG